MQIEQRMTKFVLVTYEFDAGCRRLAPGKVPLLESSPAPVPGLCLCVLSVLTMAKEPPLEGAVSLVLYELAMMRMSLGEGPPVRVMTLSLLPLASLPSVVSPGSSDSDNCFCFFNTCRNCSKNHFVIQPRIEHKSTINMYDSTNELFTLHFNQLILKLLFDSVVSIVPHNLNKANLYAFPRWFN